MSSTKEDKPKTPTKSTESEKNNLLSLKNIIRNNTLKWIFVGGKGGVGKTTCSCSLAIRLSEVRKNVLLISTDPSQSVSHTFDQTFSQTPTKVNGLPNLSVMEIDPTSNKVFPDSLFKNAPAREDTKKNLMDLFESVPGVDDLMTYAVIMKLADDSKFDAVVIDTAAHGYTSMSLLSLPVALETFLVKAISMRDRFSPMLSLFQNLQGFDSSSIADAMLHLTDLLTMVKKINGQLKDPQLTTFVCVCTPDFLSVFETEKLVQELCKKNMNCYNVVVNQLISPTLTSKCQLCIPRMEMQKKYLEQIHDLYDDFHVTELPLVAHEIRGTRELREFSDFLIR